MYFTCYLKRVQNFFFIIFLFTIFSTFHLSSNNNNDDDKAKRLVLQFYLTMYKKRKSELVNVRYLKQNIFAIYEKYIIK